MRRFSISHKTSGPFPTHILVMLDHFRHFLFQSHNRQPNYHVSAFMPKSLYSARLFNVAFCISHTPIEELSKVLAEEPPTLSHRRLLALIGELPSRRILVSRLHPGSRSLIYCHQWTSGPHFLILVHRHSCSSNHRRRSCLVVMI